MTQSDDEGPRPEAARGEESDFNERITRLELHHERRALELEAAVIAQDHRTLPVLRRFFLERRRWPRTDPRWSASWEALLWRVFSPGTVVASAGGLAVLATTVFTALAWHEANHQNELIQLSRLQQSLAVLDAPPAARPAEGVDRDVSMLARAHAVRTLCEVQRERGERSDLSGANLDHLHLEELECPGALLRGASLMSTHLDGAQLSGANLDNATLWFTGLEGASLEHATLTQAVLNRVRMDGARLRGATVTDATFSGVDLTAARGLTEEHVDASVFDAETRWPEHLSDRAAEIRGLREREDQQARSEDGHLRNMLALTETLCSLANRLLEPRQFPQGQREQDAEDWKELEADMEELGDRKEVVGRSGVKRAAGQLRGKAAEVWEAASALRASSSSGLSPKVRGDLQRRLLKLESAQDHLRSLLGQVAASR